MSRLQIDNLVGATRVEPGRSAREGTDRTAPPSEAFDEHLRRARTKAAEGDSSRADATDRAAERPSEPRRDATATPGDDEPAPAAEPAEETRPEKASKTSDERSDGAAAEQDVRDKDPEAGNEKVPFAAVVVNVTIEAIAQPAAEEAPLETAVATEPAVEKAPLEVAVATEPAVGEKNDDGAVVKDGAEVFPDSAPPAVPDGSAAELPVPSGETDAIVQTSEAEPPLGEPIEQPPSPNTNVAATADPQQAAAPTESPAAAPTESPAAAPTESSAAAPTESSAAAPAESSAAAPTGEEAVSQPTDAPVAEKPKKDARQVADSDGADEMVPSQVVPAGAPKGDTGQAASNIEEKAVVKATETDAAEPVAKPVLPAGHHDPAGSTRPASGEPLSSGTAPAATGDGANAADRVQFIERVAGAFRAASQGDGTVRMRLHPPELGSLRLEVSVRDGALSARLETDTPEARSVLLDHLPALRDRLAQQDIKIERFEVSYQNGFGGSPTGTEDHAASWDGSGRHAPGGAGAEPETPRPTRSARVSQLGAGLQLDVTV